MPSSPEKHRGRLTLAGDIEDAGGIDELLDLSLKLYKALPPRSRAPLSAPPPARTPEERGPADRWRKGIRPRNRPAYFSVGKEVEGECSSLDGWMDAIL